MSGPSKKAFLVVLAAGLVASLARAEAFKGGGEMEQHAAPAFPGADTWPANTRGIAPERSAVDDPKVRALAAVPPSATGSRESHVEVSGVLRVVAIDDFAHGTSKLVYELVEGTSGKVYELAFGDRPRGLVTGLRAKVSGVAAGRLISVPRGGFVTLSAGSQAAVTGARHAVAILVNLADATLGANCSPSIVADELFTSVDSFYREASFGQVSFPADTDGDGNPDVVGPYQLADTAADVSSLRVDVVADTEKAAAAAGVDLSRWQHHVFVLPYDASLGAYGYVGCGNNCTVVTTAWPPPFISYPLCVGSGVFAHELGHNLGMLHASVDANNDGQIDPGQEYGDGSDVMGAGHCSSSDVGFHPNAPHKDLLGWFDAFPGSILDVPVGPGPFTYTLSAEESSPAGEVNPSALRIQHSLYLSTRQKTGFESAMDNCSADPIRLHTERTNVQRYVNPPARGESPGTDGDTLLISTLGDGESMEDAATSVRVTQLAHSDQTVTVQVTELTSLFLSNGRFRVDAAWKTPDGQTGVGLARLLTGDTGLFWFFSSTNVEAFIKVLDGCSFNQHFWVFAGGLTNVDVTLTVTDMKTGVAKSYQNPQGHFFAPIQDTSAFGGCGAVSPRDAATSTGMPTSSTSGAVGRNSSANGPCVADATTLCLNSTGLTSGRFAVRTTWTTPDGRSGAGQAVTLTDDTGYFWFFAATNIEVVVKVLDGCAVNKEAWVFAGGLTDVRVETKVTDTLSGISKTYVNPQGKAFEPILDTTAFRFCG